MCFNDQHKLAEKLEELCQPWRSMIIAIDGLNGSGKSTLARFLAWKLKMPTIESDLFLKIRTGAYDLRIDDLRRAINTRLELNRPLIFEGTFILHTLRELNYQEDILIYVRKLPSDSAESNLSNLADYLVEYEPEDHADYVYEWKDLEFAN